MGNSRALPASEGPRASTCAVRPPDRATCVAQTDRSERLRDQVSISALLSKEAPSKDPWNQKLASPGSCWGGAPAAAAPASCGDAAGHETPVSLPVERIPEKALPPDHGRHCPGHQVGVVFGAVAHEVAEAQLPGLRDRKGTGGAEAASGRRREAHGSLQARP